MINPEGSSEDNINMIFEKIEHMFGKMDARGECSYTDEQQILALFDDASYYVD